MTGRVGWEAGVSAVAIWHLLTGVLGVLSGPPQSGANAEAFIRSLPPEQKSELIIRYAASAWVFPILKFRRVPAIYLSCPDKGCDPLAVSILENVRAQTPNTLGERTADRDAAQIEIYMAPQSEAFDKRDREIDARLHLNANITIRKFPFPEPAQAAPCWTITYYDNETGVIGKALVYIDSDSSPRMQYLCMGYEAIRAAGVMNMEGVYIYRKEEKRRFSDPIRWLAANAYLHGLSEIQPGDTMGKVQTILEDRYEVK